MKSIHVIALCVAIGMICGCKKNSTPQPPSINRLKTQYNGLSTSFFFYDASGRIIKDSSDIYQTSIYKHYTDSIIVSGTSSTKLLYKFYLNSSGLIDSVLDYQYLSSPHSYYKNYYNSESYLVKRVTYGVFNTRSSTDSFIIVNGNHVVTLSKYSDTAKYDTSGIYTYDATRVNTIGNDYRGSDFYGKSSKNVRVAIKAITGPDHYTYNYTYDKQNRIEQIVTTVSTGDVITTKFTYY